MLTYFQDNQENKNISSSSYIRSTEGNVLLSLKLQVVLYPELNTLQCIRHLRRVFTGMNSQSTLGIWWRLLVAVLQMKHYGSEERRGGSSTSPVLGPSPLLCGDRITHALG